MNLKIKRLHPEAIVPTRAHHDDAGLDLYAAESIAISPGARVAVATGLSMAVPSGYVGLIWDKSGVALNLGLTCLAGVLDAQYRGELKIVLLNTTSSEVIIGVGQKIAQLIVQKIELPTPIEVEKLDDTVRGDGGFGSTGM